MAAQKPSLPKGTRDFSPTEMARRRYIFSTIERVFIKYGFKPIETPSMENLSTLTGKYGDEGDKLLFKILDSGDFLNKVDKFELIRGMLSTGQMKAIEQNNEPVIRELEEKKIIHRYIRADLIAEKGLRYDLTVPFARYVVMHQNEITFPFRRYQMQPVWRADRPQKGRYREFYQCDADIIGSDSLLNEADLVLIYDEAFRNLGIDVTIKINNRKVLMGMAELLGVHDKLIAFTVAIDKLDKIGMDGVGKELADNGFNTEQVEKASGLLTYKGSIQETIAYLNSLFPAENSGKKGVEELEKVVGYLKAANFDFKRLKLDLTLARGLNYYTGAIFEVTANNFEMGSIGGGGRYDDLTGIFGLKGVSGVGISFGADRIYDVMEGLKIFPAFENSFTQLLFCCMTDAALTYAYPLANKARQMGINTEIYPSSAKLKKQLDFANANNIPFAVIIGENEMESGQLALKDLHSGVQENLTIDQILDKLSH